MVYHVVRFLSDEVKLIKDKNTDVRVFKSGKPSVKASYQSSG